MYNENKEQAAVAYSVAKRSIQSGDFPKALRFLQKIARMLGDNASTEFPDLESLIQYCNKRIESSSPSSNGIRNRNNSSKETSSTSYSSKKYTREEVEGVEHIMKYRNDYYKVLSVERSASEDKIKKAYRKMALKYHPDRCHAPNATEAFKIINAAFACLSVTEKRRTYDQFGTDDVQQVGMRRSSSSFGGVHGEFFSHEEDEIEEIFAHLFGGMFRPHFARSGPRMRRARHQQFRPQQFTSRTHHQTHQHQSGIEGSMLFILLPLMFLLAISFLGQIFTSGPSPGTDIGDKFSFVQSSHFPHEMVSQYGGIQYYVAPELHFMVSQYNSAARREWDEYIYKTHAHLTEECAKQKDLLEMANEMENGLRKDFLMRQAKQMEKRSCRRLPVHE